MHTSGQATQTLTKRKKHPIAPYLRPCLIRPATLCASCPQSCELQLSLCRPPLPCRLPMPPPCRLPMPPPCRLPMPPPCLLPTPPCRVPPPPPCRVPPFRQPVPGPRPWPWPWLRSADHPPLFSPCPDSPPPGHGRPPRLGHPPGLGRPPFQLRMRWPCPCRCPCPCSGHRPWSRAPRPSVRQRPRRTLSEARSGWHCESLTASNVPPMMRPPRAPWPPMRTKREARSARKSGARSSGRAAPGAVRCKGGGGERGGDNSGIQQSRVAMATKGAHGTMARARVPSDEVFGLTMTDSDNVRIVCHCQFQYGRLSIGRP